MHLRQRGHDFVLPNIKYEFNKHKLLPQLSSTQQVTTDTVVHSLFDYGLSGIQP